MKYTTINIKHDDYFSFMGLGILPILEKPLESFHDFNHIKQETLCYHSVSTYLHPSRLIYDAFWDKKRFRNILPDYKKRIYIIKELFLRLRDNYKIASLEDFELTYTENDKVTLNCILDSLRKGWKWGKMPALYENKKHLKDCMAAFYLNDLFCPSNSSIRGQKS